jgi:tryptophanyl-tRNA synthetase
MTSKSQRARLVTGLTATGDLHLGSYLGTMKQWQQYSQVHQCYFFIADMHAITTPQDPLAIQKRCLDMAALFLSSGIHLENTVLFNQAQVPQHAELSWVLSCMTAMGELQRMTQYKDKSAAQKHKETLGLFAYPCLMAADILLYNPKYVPVGEDQKQHLELARNLAQRFNHKHQTETFTLPEPIIPKVAARVMALGDPEKKMSKSDAAVNNTIYLLDHPEVIVKKIKRAVTDSQATIEHDMKRPGISNLVAMYAALTDQSIESIVGQYEGEGYAKFKKDLAECIIAIFTPIRERYAVVRQDESYLKKQLKQGAEKAQEVAQETLHRVYDAVGFIHSG